MKKTSVAILTLLIIVSIFSCVKRKDYSCSCTYIASSIGTSAGQPDKKETTALTDREEGKAMVDCMALESKYMGQSFSGTCVLD